MKTMRFTRLAAAAAVLIALASSSMAAVGSDQARSANASNRADTQPQSSDKTGQSSASGTTVGQGSGNTGAPLGYSKGTGESSPVGKSR